MSEWVSEWACERVCNWRNEWISESDQASACAGECVWLSVEQNIDQTEEVGALSWTSHSAHHTLQWAELTQTHHSTLRECDSTLSQSLSACTGLFPQTLFRNESTHAQSIPPSPRLKNLHRSGLQDDTSIIRSPITYSSPSKFSVDTCSTNAQKSQTLCSTVASLSSVHYEADSKSCVRPLTLDCVKGSLEISVSSHLPFYQA